MLEEQIDVHGEKRWIQQIPQIGSTCGDSTTGSKNIPSQNGNPRPSCPKHRERYEQRTAGHTQQSHMLQMSFSGEPPKFTTDIPEAVFREEADELTLRKEEKGMLVHLHRHSECGRPCMEAPLDEDWQSARASLKATKVRGGKLCTTSTWRCTMRSILRNQGSTRRQGRWALRNLVEKREGHRDDDPRNERQMSRASVRQALWEAHMESPMAALEEALSTRKTVKVEAKRERRFFFGWILTFGDFCLFHTPTVAAFAFFSHQRWAATATRRM